MSESWTGPFGMSVDGSVSQVPSADGVNWMFREGYETEMNNNGGKLALSQEAYLAKYATKRDGDGRFWYKESPAAAAAAASTAENK